MNKPAIAALLFLIVLVLGGLGFFLKPDVIAGEEKADVVPVFFTCDTRGRLEPCGCFTGQYGGLTRVRTWLDQHSYPESLLLDVGNSLSGTEDFNVIKYRHILEAYKIMGYSALNLGAAEAELPSATLQELIALGNAPLISASLISEESGDLIAPPYRIVTIRDRKVGVLGVLDPNSVPAPGEGLEILSLDAAISSYLPALAEECDEVILLAYAPEGEMKRIANEFYEFSLIVGGDVGQSSQYLQRENQSYIVFTTNQARTVGQVSLFRNSEGLDAKDFDIHLMKPNIPQNAELLALSADYRDDVRNADLLVDHPERLGENAVPGVDPIASYVGSDQCIQCHVQEAEVWHASAHSHAFETLVNKGADADPNCIGCHTVGFGTSSGYRREFGDTKLTNVGCESCHGPGSEHVNAWQNGEAPTFKFRPLGAGDCMKCHYGEFSRPFDWEAFWPLVEHGTE